MREHKYRAWDKREKRWLSVNLHMSVTDGLLWWQYCYGCEILSAEERKNIELVQYTGLKDKNGKDIYEGDFLKDNYGRILLVEWYRYCFSFKAITETNFLRAHDVSQWFENVGIFPEIIGNVFENPKLTETDQ